MKLGNIGNRMLLAAVLPVFVLSLVATLVHVLTRMDDLSLSHRQRARAMARQVAATAEYGVFSGNRTQLQSLAQRALLDGGVQTVRIDNGRGDALAMVGSPLQRPLPAPDARSREWFDDAANVDMVIMPILAGELGADDVFSRDASKSPALLGRVVMEFSRSALRQSERDVMWIGTLISAVGVLFGSVLALILTRSINRPVLRVLRMIERLARGEMGVRGQVSTNDPLREIQLGLNRMAESLEASQQDLRARIDEATQAVREQRDAAERATQDKSRFLAAASHDLRQPTTALGLFVDRLAQLPHDATSQQLVMQVSSSVQALQHLLDDLLDLSQLEAGNVRAQEQDFVLDDVFDQLERELVMTARTQGLRLRVRRTGALVHSDPRLLYRILANLMGNALRYTEQGCVTLVGRVDHDPGWIRVQVRDSGVGIPAEYQAMVFQEFVQMDHRAGARLRGHGLGLSIVAQLVALLGLKLDLRSAPGRGTTITLRVPRAFAPRVESSLPQRIASHDLLTARTVLVVEDDALTQEALRGVLESWGMRVITGASLGDALHLLQQGGHPDFVISDYRLVGDGDGFAVIRHARSVCGRALPACLISGDADEALMARAQEAGLALLRKPVQASRLRSLLQRLLRDDQSDARA